MTVLSDNEFMVLELFEAAEVSGAPPPTNVEIGERLGWTLNMAAGACKRLRDKGLIRVRPRSRLLEDRMRYWRSEPVPESAAEDAPIPWNAARDSQRKVPDLTPRPCQWFVVDLPKHMRLAWRSIDGLKCKAPCVEGRPYCDKHNRRARGAA